MVITYYNNNVNVLIRVRTFTTLSRFSLPVLRENKGIIAL